MSNGSAAAITSCGTRASLTQSRCPSMGTGRSSEALASILRAAGISRGEFAQLLR